MTRIEISFISFSIIRKIRETHKFHYLFKLKIGSLVIYISLLIILYC